MNNVMWKKQNKKDKRIRIFDYNGTFTYYMDKVFDLISISLLWLLCCIPVITIGASTTALYYTLHKVWKQNDSYITKEFFHALYTNLKPATLLWGILAIVSLILQLNLGIVGEKMSGNIQIFFFMFYGILLFIWTGVQIYAFPVLARFDMPVGWIFKLALYLCFRHFGRTIVLLAVTMLAIAGVYVCWPTVLLTPALANCMYEYLLEPILKKYMLKTVSESQGIENK